MLASSGTACSKDFRYSDVSFIEDEAGVFFLLVVSWFKLQAPPPHVSDSSLIFLDVTLMHSFQRTKYDPKCCLEQLQRKNQLTHSFISLTHNADCPSHTFLSAIRKTRIFRWNSTRGRCIKMVFTIEWYERSELYLFSLLSYFGYHTLKMRPYWVQSDYATWWVKLERSHLKVGQYLLKVKSDLFYIGNV